MLSTDLKNTGDGMSISNPALIASLVLCVAPVCFVPKKVEKKEDPMKQCVSFQSRKKEDPMKTVIYISRICKIH